LRHYTDDRKRTFLDADGLAKRTGVRLKILPPEVLADDRYRQCAPRSVFGPDMRPCRGVKSSIAKEFAVTASVDTRSARLPTLTQKGSRA
jgi:hypothetical protein